MLPSLSAMPPCVDKLTACNFQGYVARGVGMDVEEHIDVRGLGKLMHAMFPQEAYTETQIEDGFTLIDLKGSGKIVFEDFCEWWTSMKFTDKLGLRQQWKRDLYESEIRAAGELEKRAYSWRRKNAIRRWSKRIKLVVYYKFKSKIIAQKHHFSVRMDHVKAWRALILSNEGKGPGFGKPLGVRIKEADRNSERRSWGRAVNEDTEWTRTGKDGFVGGAQVVDSKRGQHGSAQTPGGIITRTVAPRTPPGNFALRPQLRKTPDPQATVSHAPLRSPRNQQTNLKGSIKEFTRMSGSKYGNTLQSAVQVRS